MAEITTSSDSLAAAFFFLIAALFDYLSYSIVSWVSKTSYVARYRIVSLRSIVSSSYANTVPLSNLSWRAPFLRASKSKDFNKFVLMCLSSCSCLLSSGSFELAKLDSMSTFYMALISLRLSRASLFLLISLSSRCDLVSF